MMTPPPAPNPEPTPESVDALAAPPGDSESPDETPPHFEEVLAALTPRAIATPILIGVNVAVFVVMVVSGVSAFTPEPPLMIEWGANFGQLTLTGQWWRLLTCTFLHFGIVHLALNMIVLAQVGFLVERLVGNFGYVLLYVVAGVVGSLASLWWNPEVVSAGASGSVFGVVGALIGFLVIRQRAVPPAALARLAKNAGFFVIVNLAMGMTTTGIDNAAHVGGLLGGFLCGMALSRPITAPSGDPRVGRNLLVAAGATALILGGGLLVEHVHRGMAHPLIELQRFDEIERRTLAAYNRAVSRLQAGQLPPSELANLIDRDILPEWRAASSRLRALPTPSGPSRESFLTRLEYIQLRVDGWQLSVAGVREPNPRKLDQAAKKLAAADALVRKMRAQQKR